MSTAQQAPPTRVVHLRGKVSNWWTRASTIVGTVAKHRRRQGGEKQLGILYTSAGRLLSDVPEQVHRVLRRQDRFSWRQWREFFFTT
eukprot:6568956-Pyramimonas_sp.AAC.1